MRTHTKDPRYSHYINRTVQVSDVWHFTCKLNRNCMLCSSHPLTWRWGHTADNLKIQCIKRKVQLSMKRKNHILVVTVPVHQHCWQVTKLISIGPYISLLQTHKLQRISWLNHDWRVPRSRFIHDTFSVHLFSPSLSLSRSLSAFLSTTTLDIRCSSD